MFSTTVELTELRRSAQTCAHEQTHAHYCLPGRKSSLELFIPRFPTSSQHLISAFTLLPTGATVASDVRIKKKITMKSNSLLSAQTSLTYFWSVWLFNAYILLRHSVKEMFHILTRTFSQSLKCRQWLNLEEAFLSLKTFSFLQNNLACIQVNVTNEIN